MRVTRPGGMVTGEAMTGGFRKRLGRFGLLVGFGLLTQPGVGQSPPPGVVSHTFSNGAVILAYPRHDLRGARGTVYLPLPPGVGRVLADSARQLESLVLDTPPREGAETGRQVMATVDARVWLGLDERHLMIHLHTLPDGLPRAVTTLLGLLRDLPLDDGSWGRAAGGVAFRRHLEWAAGWPANREELAVRVMHGQVPTGGPLFGDPPAHVVTEGLAGAWSHALRPAGWRIVLSGRVDSAEVARQVADLLSGWPAEPHPAGEAPPFPAPSPPGGGGYLYREWAIPAKPARVVLFFRGPALGSAAFPAFLTAGCLVADGFTSLAGRDLLVAEPRAPFILETGLHIGERGTLLRVELLGLPDRLDVQAARLFAAAELAGRGEWLDIDLTRGRNQAFRLWVDALGGHEAEHRRLRIGLPPLGRPVYDECRARLAALSPAQVARAARERLTLDRSVVFDLPGGRNHTPETFRATVDGLRPALIPEIRNRMREWPDVPILAPAADPEPSGHWERANDLVASGILRGPEVLLCARGHDPLVRMMVYYPGGRRIEPAGLAGLGQLALWRRLLTERDPQQRLLLEGLEAMGGRVRVVEGWEHSGVEAEFPARHRRAAAALVARILHRRPPTIDSARDVLAWGALLASGTSSPAAELHAESLAGLLGPGQPFHADSSGLAALAPEALVAHDERYLYRTLPAIALVGGFQGTELLGGIGEEVSGSRFRPLPLQPLRNPPVGTGAPPAGPSGPHWVELTVPGFYPGDPDNLRGEILGWLAFRPGAAEGPPIGLSELRVEPLAARGVLRITFQSDGADLPGRVTAFREWAAEFVNRPLDTWRLATAVKMARLDLWMRQADAAGLARWLALHGVMGSGLWRPAVQDEALLRVRKEQVRDLAVRSLAAGPIGVAARPVPAGESP